MATNRTTHHDALPDEEDYGGGFNDDELPPLFEEELRESTLQAEIFLEQERVEREALAEQFEEELDALFAVIKPGEKEQREEVAEEYPPGWPDL